MRRLLWLSLASVVACGGGARDVTVTLESSTLEMIDPYAASANMRRVRVQLSAVGPETVDEVAADLDLATKTVTFSEIQDPATIEIRAEGYDDLGNAVAYGRKLAIEDEGDLNVTFPLRRNVAYVTHLPDEMSPQPQGELYVLDVVTRAYLGKVALPGGGQARQVTARGGKSMLVVFVQNGQGKLGVLDAGTHEWTTIDLDGAAGDRAGRCGQQRRRRGGR